MIVIGLDVHKQSVTAVAVDEAGRPISERVIRVGSDELLGWAVVLDGEQLWAVVDCRQLTGWLERQLLEVGEELVRVPPKLTVPERRAGRARGKSDPIDALAVARAALREPDLAWPSAGERVLRDLKLLVDHRDDLVDRRRMQQRLRWHLQALDPTFEVPLRKVSRPSELERVGRWLARQPTQMQVRLARELVSRWRALNRTIAELDQELEQRVCEVAPALLELPGCAAVTHRRQAARRDRPDRPLPKRRATRPPRRRRTARSELRPQPKTPTRPRRQPPTQRRPLPDRNHTEPLPPARPRLPRAQTQRREERNPALTSQHRRSQASWPHSLAATSLASRLSGAGEVSGFAVFSASETTYDPSGRALPDLRPSIRESWC
jgi:transposase